MQNLEPLPERFTIKSTLGIFIMEQAEDGAYGGSANGFTCNVGIGDRFTASLATTDERWAHTSSELNGTFISIGSLSEYLADWFDTICSEYIEDYASDVRYLETGYGRLAYWAYNEHLSGTPIVFVHGGPGGDSNPVKARRLHLENPVYLFDQMGCGMSDPIRDLENFHLDEYYEEMSQFINSIPSEKVILVGASWGAGLSLYYAGRSEFTKVAALILPSPFLSSAKWTEDAIENLRDMGSDYLERFQALASQKDYGEEFTSILGEYNARYLFNRSIFREYGIVSASEIPNEVFRTLCGPNDLITDGKLKDFDVTPYLSKINVPTLLMCADSDEIRIDRLLEYYRLVKGARLSIIPHAGHVLALEQFDSYRDAITAFISENNF